MNGAAVIQPAPIPFYTVLVLYLGIMAFIGWYAGRKTNNIGDFFVLSGKAGGSKWYCIFLNPVFHGNISWYTGNHLRCRLCRNGYLCTWSCVLYDSSGSSYWP